MENYLLRGQTNKLRQLKKITLRNLDIRNSSSSKHRPSITTHSRTRRNTLIEYPENDKPSELQNINLDKLIDSFVSIHQVGRDEPFYVSEIVYHSMDVDFKEIETPQELRNYSQMILKVWSKRSRDSESDWILLYYLELDLNKLTPMGRVFQEMAFDPNTVILQLDDECYFANNAKPCKQQRQNSDSYSEASVSSCSYDSIRKLNQLTYSIKETQSSQKYLTSEISKFLSENKINYNFDKFESNRKLIKSSIDKESSNIERLRTRLNAKKIQLQKLNKVLNHDQNDTISKYQEELQLSRESLGQLLSNYHKTKELIEIEKSRVLNTLNEVYPIVNIDNTPIYKILDLRVPFKIDTQSKTIDTELDAALGFISQLVYLLEHYLSVPLKYPVQPYGSKSYILDPVSQLTGSRMFPLWQQDTTSLNYRFEYGLMLLNENIIQLIESYNNKVPESKNMLGNLKFLLLCLSSYDHNTRKSSEEQAVNREESPGLKLSAITQSFQRRSSRIGT